jgi:hypothetical protein
MANKFKGQVPPKSKGSTTPVLDKSNRIFVARITAIAKGIKCTDVKFEDNILDQSEAVLIFDDGPKINVLIDTYRGCFVFSGVWPTNDAQVELKPTSAKPFRVATSLNDDDIARNVRTRYVDWYLENYDRELREHLGNLKEQVAKAKELKGIIGKHKFADQPDGSYRLDGKDCIIVVKHSHDSVYAVEIQASAKLISDLVAVIDVEGAK